ncbi:MAG TPA: hypothetical protein VH083_27585 [Myxococcales bacterium]|nr:hypothetical protein [Myxococcales bacterium]
MTWLLLAALAAPAASGFGVICIAPSPAPADSATGGKGSSGGNYDDSPEARAKRVEAAKRAPPRLFRVGAVTSAPVTASLAACIDKIPVGSKQVLRSGQWKLPFRIKAEQPVLKYSCSSFYGSDSLEPVEQRLYCPKRSPAPDCSWCPCRVHRYVPPPSGQSR